MKKNVHLILRNTDALSGTPRILRRQVDLLDDVSNVSVIADNFHPELLQNKKISRLKTYKWPKNGLFQRQFFDWQAQRLTRSHKADIVIGHGDSLIQDILFMHVCIHKGADLNPPQYQKNISVPFHRQIFEEGQFETLVCNSKMMRDDLSKRFDIRAKTHILYPGYEESITKTLDHKIIANIRDQVTKNKYKTVLGLITSGDLGNRGAYHLIRSLNKLPKDVCLLIVGKENKPEKLYKLAEEYGVKDQLTWMPPRPDVANYFMAIDILVHAAQMEAFGMSVLEAMALKRPIITTQTVGCSELLPPVQQDFIIDSQDENLITSAIEKMLALSHQWNTIGEENAQKAKLYTWEAFDKNFLTIIEEYLYANPLHHRSNL